MLQQAMKRLVPTSLLQGRTAVATRIGLETPVFQHESKRENHNGAFQSQPVFHVPTLLSNLLVSERKEDKQQSTSVAQFNANSMTNSLNVRTSGASALPLGLAGSSLTTKPMGMPVSLLRSASTSPLALMRKKGYAMPLQPHSLISQRNFITEGELVGSAYLLTTDIMFWSGMIGAVIFRRNLIVMLLCTEIVMLACNMNFLFASAYLNDMTGVIMSITITTIAACETAIGLALCVTYFHLRSATDVEALNLLK